MRWRPAAAAAGRGDLELVRPINACAAVSIADGRPPFLPVRRRRCLGAGAVPAEAVGAAPHLPDTSSSSLAAVTSVLISRVC